MENKYKIYLQGDNMNADFEIPENLKDWIIDKWHEKASITITNTENREITGVNLANFNHIAIKIYKRRIRK